MSPAVWLLSRMAAAVLWAGLFALAGYYVIVPTVVRWAYRREGLCLDRFLKHGGEEAAGSEDAVYFAARYNNRRGVTRLSGVAPEALYWMIGIYDDRLQRIPAGHVNDKTVELNADGEYNLIIQSSPGNPSTTLECGDKLQGLVIMRVFLPEDEEAVSPPEIERVSDEDVG